MPFPSIFVEVSHSVQARPPSKSPFNPALNPSLCWTRMASPLISHTKTCCLLLATPGLSAFVLSMEKNKDEKHLRIMTTVKYSKMIFALKRQAGIVSEMAHCTYTKTRWIEKTFPGKCSLTWSSPTSTDLIFINGWLFYSKCCV